MSKISAKVIERERSRAGLSVEEAAQLLHMSAQRWRDAEAGKFKMPADRWNVFLRKSRHVQKHPQ